MVALVILIEPFGIETKLLVKSCLRNKILIEPFGIETRFKYVSAIICLILIEPFGIETKSKKWISSIAHNFNRTIWN